MTITRRETQERSCVSFLLPRHQQVHDAGVHFHCYHLINQDVARAHLKFIKMGSRKNETRETGTLQKESLPSAEVSIPGTQELLLSVQRLETGTGKAGWLASAGGRYGWHRKEQHTIGSDCTRGNASSNSATTRKPKRPTGDLSTRG